MTLLFFDGLQDPILVPKPEYQSTNGWSGTTAGRDGVSNGASSGGGNGTGRFLNLPTSAATCIFGAALQWSTSALTNPMVLGFQSDITNTGTGTQLVLTTNASGMLEVRRSSATGTLLGTSSGHSPLQPLAWYHVAFKGVLSSTTSGSFSVQLNGVTVLSVTGVITSSVTGNVFSVRYQTGIGVSAVFIDDIYVCDAVDATATQGRPNNDFLGDIRVTALFPTAAGDVTGWTPSTGANWAAVDDNPASATDYVSAVATSTGTRDLYNCSDLAANSISVYAVRVNLYTLKSDAGAALIKPVIKESGGTITAQASQAPSTTVGALSGPMLVVKPSNSAVWTVSDVNAAQIGVEVG